MKSRVYGLLLCSFLISQANAQTVDELQARYPAESAVFKTYKQHLRFFMLADTPMAELTTVQELVPLKESNASFFSRSAVYFSHFRQLKNFEAFTILPGGKKLKVTETKTTASPSESVFYDDVKEMSFDYPGLTRGATAHVQYTTFFPEAHLVSPLAYYGNVPALNVEFVVEAPEHFDLRFLPKNDDGRMGTPLREVKRGVATYTWRVKEWQPLRGYGDAPDDDYFEPHLVVTINSFKNSKGTQAFAATPDDYYRWSSSFTQALNKTNDAKLEALTKTIIAHKKSDMEKATAIYQWVQRNIRYVAFENGLEGFRPRQAADVFNKRYGDCKDMSSILTTMMRMAGIEAYYTWIGTRSIPYTHTEVPMPFADNHMISTARIDGKWYFIDGTSPNSTIELPPTHIHGKEALVGMGDKFKLVEVPYTAATITTTADTTILQLDESGLIKGTTVMHFSGHAGEDVHNALLYTSEKSKEDYVRNRLLRGSNKFTLQNWNVVYLDDNDKRAGLKGEFTLPGFATKVGSEYYLNLNLLRIFDKQHIDTTQRKVPRQSEYRYKTEIRHQLNIPDGYKVEYLPKDFEVTTPHYEFSIQYTRQGNKVSATQRFTNKTLMLWPKDFASWNKPIRDIEAQYKEQIVLQKIK